MGFRILKYAGDLQGNLIEGKLLQIFSAKLYTALTLCMIIVISQPVNGMN